MMYTLATKMGLKEAGDRETHITHHFPSSIVEEREEKVLGVWHLLVSRLTQIGIFNV
jgi:hypothetical protein